MRATISANGPAQGRPAHARANSPIRADGAKGDGARRQQADFRLLRRQIADKPRYALQTYCRDHVTTGKTSQPAAEGPGIERTVTLTDAVVAIAMTLLILPLVEVSGDVDADHLGAFFSGHGNLLLSFVISFLVIYVFWAAHGSALARPTTAQTVAPGLRQLNMWWLLVIAFLPFPTAVVGRDLTTRSAPLYIGTMFVLSALTSAITLVVDRAVAGPRRGAWAWVTTAVFATCTLLAVFDADLGLFALLSLVAVRGIEVRGLDPVRARTSPAVSVQRKESPR